MSQEIQTTQAIPQDINKTDLNLTNTQDDNATNNTENENYSVTIEDCVNKKQKPNSCQSTSSQNFANQQKDIPILKKKKKEPATAKKNNKKKTYSLEEKGEILTKILSATHEIYSIKELEKLIPKKSNNIINSIQLKDVLKYCMDEDMVKCEKCGILNIYYSFPILHEKILENRYLSKLENLNNLKELVTKLKSEHQEISQNKQEIISNNKLLKKLKISQKEFELEIEQLQNQLKTQDFDKMVQSLILLNQEKSKLRDNIFTLSSFILNKTNNQHISLEDFFISMGFSKTDVDIINDYEN
ncbi:hypothetical protein HANVADRAFT_115096 [Hanseniaspora valbyensis NRRL Y-1626]|uniref:Mnd1 HTH domain-containing protein n=1 Tax=Hanseniaspora valbyensis NRRL Y-1626 TaxID=766949 RepID=A0A1B7TA09_9ASCO|nr:hypothetical protein HANVADRAFT_115096 [Hanseniaspora valbyensis NRRL Y-1626]